VDAAVKRAMAEHVVPAIVELKQQAPVTSQVVDPKAERFVSMAEMCQRLGVNRTTVLRRERSGKIPKRRTFPDGQTGWSSLDVEAWFAGSKTLVRDDAANHERASRLRNH